MQSLKFIAFFGDVRTASARKEFERKWMCVYSPSLRLRDAIPNLPTRIYCNRLLLPYLERAFDLVAVRKLGHLLETWDGCFNIRLKRNGMELSVHSWGMAIDINAATNPYGKKPILSPLLVACFTEAGFKWGGYWKYPDGMHFEVALPNG